MRPLALSALLLAACGPQLPMTSDGDADTGDATGSTAAPATTGAATTANPGATTEPATTDLDSDGSTSSTTASVFISGLDFGGCGAAFGEYDVRCSRCDPWRQDCWDGTKCSPYSSDGDDVWDHVKCVELDPAPAHPGEPCTVAGAVATGVDNCDLDSMCFHIDPETLTGTCVRMCDGSPDDPECPLDTACRISHDGYVVLCLPTCDPLLGDCPAGQVCARNDSDEHSFVCLPDASGAGGQLFGACDGPATCDPGLHCGPPGGALECDPQAPGCCTPWCDLAMPTCPGAGQDCLPVFPDDQGPGFINIGFCGVPQ